MATKKIIQNIEKVSPKKVVRVKHPAKSINKPLPKKVEQPGKALRLTVKVQTAEGWKRNMQKKHPLKIIRKVERPVKSDSEES